jgi:hypothetical protein
MAGHSEQLEEPFGKRAFARIRLEMLKALILALLLALDSNEIADSK